MFSIRNRILFSMCFLTAFAASICLYFGAWLFFSQLKNSSLKTLRTGKETLQATINYEFLKLISDTKILASLSDFINKIESRQGLAVLKIAEKFQEEMQLSEVSSYDNDGNPISLNNKEKDKAPLNFFSNEQNKPLFSDFKNALIGKANARFYSGSKEIKFIFIAPIVSAKKNVCGILTTTIMLDSHFADKVSQLTGTDVTFFSNGNLVSTSIQTAVDRKNVADEFIKNQKQENDINKTWSSGSSFFLLTQLGKEYLGENTFAVLSLSNKENLYIFDYIKSFIILFGIFIIASSLVMGTFLSSGIILGLKKLERNAASIASGKLDTKIEINSSDEVGKLAKSFDSMRHSISKLILNLKETNASYQRFVPREFLELLKKNDIIHVKLGDCLQTKMTVLFSDIRDFTTMSEQMSPQENFEFINNYLKLVAPIIKGQGGFIDKYIGDAVMALFPNEAYNAVIAACEMRKCLSKINEDRQAQGKNILKIGIGLNTGSVILGVVGEAQRIDATVISDTVNLASRVENMTKSLNCAILMTKETYNELSETQKQGIKYVGEHQVKGKVGMVSLYEIKDII